MICLLAMVCIFSVTALPAGAVDNGITASFNENTGLSISGRIGSEYKAAVLAVITHSSNIIDESIAPDLTKNMTATYVFNTKARTEAAAAGDFAAVIPLPTQWYDAADGETHLWYNGEYRLYLYSAENVISTVFSYSLRENLLSLIDDVNAAASVSDIKALLTEPANRLAVSSTYSTECIEETAKVFYKNRRINYTADDAGAALLQEDYKAAEAVARLRCGATVGDIINEYATVFGADAAAFENYKEDVKNGISSYLKTADYTPCRDSGGLYSTQTAAKTAYFNACLFSEIRYSQDWTALKAAVIKYDAAINPDKDTFFNNIVNKDDVYVNMWDCRETEIISMSSIKTAFEKQAEAVYKKENPPKVNPSGGGGGGGGRTNAQIEKNNIADKIKDAAPDNDTAVFSDIIGHWAREYIITLAKKGAVSGFGDNTFRPDTPITRAELVTILLSALGKKAIAKAPFKDVAESDWYAPYLAAAHNAGIIQGDSEGNFRPNEPVTRQDAATIIYRALNRGKAAYTETEFSDNDAISDYAKTAVASMQKNGIIRGMPNGSFAPLSGATRAEAAVMIARSVYK